MRVLLTGGCGFLGSHIVEHFLKNTDADVEIVILDKLTYASNGYDRLRDISANLPYGLPERVRVLGCDLSQPVPKGVLRELGDIDYIIHAAAESHVDNSIRDPLPFLMSNVVGTHHLLMLACMLQNGLGSKPQGRVGGLRRVFVVSTDEVYGPAPSLEQDGLEIAKQGMLREWLKGFAEGDRFRPANPYAASKAAAECVAMAYANTYGLPITIVNTMNLIGERQHPEKFVPKVIRSVLRGDTVTIHADATKTQAGSRFYLHCRTFAHALHWLIQKDAETFAAGLGTWQSSLKIHVCGEREIDNLELAQIIASYVGEPLHYELVDFHSARPGHDLRYAMDDSLIQKMGWVRPMGLEKSLEKTVRWYLDHPKWLGED